MKESLLNFRVLHVSSVGLNFGTYQPLILEMFHVQNSQASAVCLLVLCAKRSKTEKV